MNVVITGAGRGIGYALTKTFLGEGHSVIAISRNIEKLKSVNNKNLYPFSFDLRQSGYSDVLNLIKKTFQKVDILINNAGVMINKPFGEMTDDDFDLLFNVHVKAAFKMIRELVPFMENGGHVVNISSMGGVQGSVKFSGLSLYSAAKGALNILTETMALELSDNGISVNALALGAVQTEMLSAAFPGYEAPLNPGEIASFIMDFAVSGNKVLNGKVLPVSLSTP
jgi:NAD(P)-dependent dehydrogenase (short-subunit alcohol dehydrogenase family)